MPTLQPSEYADVSPEVRAVYDDILTTSKTDYINNFWKALDNDPSTLRRTWEGVKQVMAPGALNPLTKELVYMAVSITSRLFRRLCPARAIKLVRPVAMKPDLPGR